MVAKEVAHSPVFDYLKSFLLEVLCTGVTSVTPKRAICCCRFPCVKMDGADFSVDFITSLYLLFWPPLVGNRFSVGHRTAPLVCGHQSYAPRDPDHRSCARLMWELDSTCSALF